MSSKKALAVVGDVGLLPDKPGASPGISFAQDEVRETALTIYAEKGLPFLAEVIEDTDRSDRIRLDAVKIVSSQAIPPPQPVIGDVAITIVVDL